MARGRRHRRWSLGPLIRHLSVLTPEPVYSITTPLAVRQDRSRSRHRELLFPRETPDDRCEETPHETGRPFVDQHDDLHDEPWDHEGTLPIERANGDLRAVDA